jgi:hypothetical protein
LSGARERILQQDVQAAQSRRRERIQQRRPASPPTSPLRRAGGNPMSVSEPPDTLCVKLRVPHLRSGLCGGPNEQLHV